MIGALLIWQHSLVLQLLFSVRVLVYEQSLALCVALLLYLLVGSVLSFKTRKILPFFLAGFLLFAVAYNLFASYQEVTKFGISQDVFTGLITVLLHSPVVPLLLVSMETSYHFILGWLAFGLLFFKGFVIMKKWVKTTFFEQVLLSFALGFGITAFTTFLLAALQFLTFRNVLLVDAAFFSAVFILPRGQIELPHIHIELTLKEKKVLILLGLILSGGFLYAAVFPPLEWDSLAYQAYYSKLVYENQGLPLLFGPSIGIEMSAAYPPAYQMVGCYIYAITGEANAQFMSVLSYISGVLSLVAVFLVAHHFVPTHRIYAVVAALAVPFFLAFSSSPHYLTLLILFNSLFLFYLAQYIRTEDVVSLYCSAVFLGFACLTSYLGLASFLFLILVYVEKRFSLILLVQTFVIAGIVAVPPLLRNFYYTTNPLFPLFGIGRQLENPLWVSNTSHFETQTIYAGLKVTSPFSVLDFFMNRISSVRPLLPVIMVIGLVFLLFIRPIREKKWLTTCFLASVFIFLIRPTFDRYLLIYIPVYATFFAWLLKKSELLPSPVFKRSLQLALVASLSIVAFGIVVTGPMMVASHLKQFPERPLDYWAYVRQFYPHDTPCWRFLNENTPSYAYVATYDIRYYYIDKKIFALDGLQAVPLYEMTPEEALTFLQEQKIVYWFSSRWTSPADATCPPAYFDNPLTLYLGSDILPLVFVSGQSAVYGVGRQRVDYQRILETDTVLYPVHKYIYHFNQGSMVYFDIPGDLHGKSVGLHFSCSVTGGLYSGHAASPELLGELVEEIHGTQFVMEAYSGKYTLYIESDEPFTATVFIA